MQASGSGSPASPETSRRVVTARTPEPTRARLAQLGGSAGSRGALLSGLPPGRQWALPVGRGGLPRPIRPRFLEPEPSRPAGRARAALLAALRGAAGAACASAAARPFLVSDGALPSGLAWSPWPGPAARRALHLPAGVRSASSLILGGRTSGNWCHLFDGPEVFRKAVNRVSVLLRGSRNVFLGGCSVRFWSCWLINQQFHSSASWIGPCCAAGALPCFPHRPDKCRTRGDGASSSE